MRVLSVAIALSCILCSVAEVRYDNYKLYRVVPETREQLDTLRALQSSSRSSEYSFWTDAVRLGTGVDVMVAPHRSEEWMEFLKRNYIKSTIHMEDVQESIDSSKKVQVVDRLLTSSRLDLPNLGSFHSKYHTLDEIHKYLEDLQTTYSPKAEVLNIGNSYKGNPLLGVKINYEGDENIVKKVVFIECGIHARERISPAVCIYLIERLLIIPSDAPILDVIKNLEFQIFPVVNPDGYEYTHTTDRLWRKTRKMSYPGLLPVPFLPPPIGSCWGTDPNRNFDFHWGDVSGSSSDPCSETYHGEYAFSEPETKAIRDHVANTITGDKLLSYISVHSYSQLCLLPYAVTDTESVVLKPHDYERMEKIAKFGMEELEKPYHTVFEVGNTVELLYVATGDSADYFKYINPISNKLALSFELRDKGTYGFLLPPNQIVPSGDEFTKGILAIFAENDRTP